MPDPPEDFPCTCGCCDGTFIVTGGTITISGVTYPATPEELTDLLYAALESSRPAGDPRLN